MQFLFDLKPGVLCAVTFLFPLLGTASAQQRPASQPNYLTRIETLHGYLIDLVCVREEADRLADLGPGHTRKCLQMPACDRGGFALLLSSNEVLEFDHHGNRLARELVSRRHQEKAFLVKVTGKCTGDRISVLRIE